MRSSTSSTRRWSARTGRPSDASWSEAYRTLPFPWREESAPPFALETDWDLQQVMGYLATWSAVQRYKDQRGEDPLPALAPRLAAEWPDGKARRLRWPIHLRIGRA